MFDIELSVREFSGQAVVALRGELDLASTPAVASHLLAAVATCGRVIVDLAGLDDICEAGLAMLVRGREWAQENGGDLALAAPRASVREILKVAGLADVFRVYPSVEHASAGPATGPIAVPLADERCLRAYHAEFVSLGVGQHRPRLLAGLADVDATGAEGQETLNLCVAIPGTRGEIEVNPVLDCLGIGHGHEAHADGRVLSRADNDLALTLRQNHPVERPGPEPGK